MTRRGDSLHRCPKLLPRACFGTRPARPWPSASSKPTAASLLWYTADAALAFSIIQTRCRGLALVHGRRDPGLRHHPNTPSRACFGTRPARPWPAASSKHTAARLPWCMARRGDSLHRCPKLPPRAYLGAGQDAVTDFTVTQDSRCGLALVHGRRGPDLQHHPNTLPRAYLGA